MFCPRMGQTVGERVGEQRGRWRRKRRGAEMSEGEHLPGHRQRVKNAPPLEAEGSLAPRPSASPESEAEPI